MQTKNTEKVSNGDLGFIRDVYKRQGKRRVVYSNDLLELREKEKELVRNQLDGLESYCSGKTTLNLSLIHIYREHKGYILYDAGNTAFYQIDSPLS